MNETFLEKMRRLAPTLLRLGLSLVFLWFGFQQIFYTSAWISLIPEWVTSLSGFSAATLVHFNGAFEIVFGICLFLGFFTRTVALLLALHMLHITLTVGYNSIGVRDFGLSMATLSVFLHGVDSGCLDRFLAKNDKYAINLYAK